MRHTVLKESYTTHRVMTIFVTVTIFVMTRVMARVLHGLDEQLHSTMAHLCGLTLCFRYVFVWWGDRGVGGGGGKWVGKNHEYGTLF